MRVVVAAFAVVACVHAALWVAGRERVTAPPAPAKFPSLSFAPYDPKVSPEKNQATTQAQVRKDVAAVAPYTKSIRTYSAIGGLEFVPAAAAEYNLPVSQGIWIDKFEDRNAKEIAAGLELAKKHRNIKSLVVGNEVILRADKTPEEMIEILRKVKAQSPVPITMGEVWHVWERYPELASAVDFIAVHILPYWEGVPADQAVDVALGRYEKLRRMFPGKHIVIAEFGWPSGGYNLWGAEPGPLKQASIVRDFMSRAAARGIDYNLVEAFDQPWKTFEGSVGPYWGVMDSERKLKFPLSGPLESPNWPQRVAVALLMGLLLSLPILRLPRPTFAQAALLSAAANAVGAWVAVVLDHWLSHYFVLGAHIAMGMGLLFLVPLAVVVLSRMEEIAAIAFGRTPARLISAKGKGVVPANAPKVSIHIPAYREPPEMLMRTLDSVARLEYPNFECVVVINNTPDPALWRPIEEHCKLLGERFKFLNIPKLEGFKAGALRHAMAVTAEDAEIIGIIDADYVVDPAWLKDLVPAFADPRVGLVQAPQDHRDAERTPMHWAMNTEYAGFFDIGMVQRNEDNAIIVHGTMCLVRRKAMDEVGGWSSDTICEDSDLGLAILEAGYTAHYTRERYGWGLLPDGYEAFRKQRHRWAFGGVQIAVKHLKHFFNGKTRLSREQRQTYLVGWLNWMGAETLGVALAILNLVWVPVVAFGGIAVPEMVLTLPIIAGFVVYLVHFFTLYHLRVKHQTGATIGAAISAMALQLTVARAVTEALVKQHMPFIRTAKGGSSAAMAFPAFWEAVMAGLLVFGAFLVWYTNHWTVREINLFAVVLLVQALPFMAAVGLALYERSRLNDFAVLARVRGRALALLPRPRTQPSAAPDRVEV